MTSGFGKKGRKGSLLIGTQIRLYMTKFKEQGSRGGTVGETGTSIKRGLWNRRKEG